MKVRLFQIIRMLEVGPRSSGELADRLGLSTTTARRHVQRLRKEGYWIELDASGRYFLLGKGLERNHREEKGLGYGERIEGIEKEMEKAAYRYILEGTVSGMMARRNARGTMVSRFTPQDLADHLGVDVGVAERILQKLEEARYLIRYGRPKAAATYHPREGWIYNAFRCGMVAYDEDAFSKLISKKQFIWPEGVGLSLVASKEEQLPDGKTYLEIYSNSGLELIKDITEGFLELALDAQGRTFMQAMPEIPDTGTENDIQPESNMLARFLSEFNPINPWPSLWLMDLHEDMAQEEWRNARNLFWSRAMRFLLILLRPIHSPLREFGLEGCVKMTEEKMSSAEGRPKPHGRATDTEILRKSLETMGARRFWELSRALCLELLGSCLRVCDGLRISDEGTAEASGVVQALKDQQRAVKGRMRQKP